MKKSATRTVATGLVGFSVLTLAGVAILGMNPGGSTRAPAAADAAVPSTAAVVRPVDLSIPRLALKQKLVGLGVASGGVMQLPPESGAGWWTGSAVPGQPGVAVVAGFIRSGKAAPGAFVHLKALKQHDQISIKLSNGSRSTYEVTSIRTYPQGTLPATELSSTTGQPVLKLVTTGGALKPGDPNENVVVTGMKLP